MGRKEEVWQSAVVEVCVEGRMTNLQVATLEKVLKRVAVSHCGCKITSVHTIEKEGFPLPGETDEAEHRNAS